jgi:integrase/recombinase XerD
MDATQTYLHSDIELKEKALAKTEPFRGGRGRYRPPDQILAFLQAL